MIQKAGISEVEILASLLWKGSIDTRAAEFAEIISTKL